VTAKERNVHAHSVHASRGLGVASSIAHLACLAIELLYYDLNRSPPSAVLPIQGRHRSYPIGGER
jgi:hypothetical protein